MPATLLSSVVTQSRLTLCNPMDCSTPGFPVHHQLLELAQTHVHQVGDGVHRVGDGIQPSHPLLFPSPLPSTFPSIRVLSSKLALHIRWPSTGASVSVLPKNIQDYLPLGLTGLISLLSLGQEGSKNLPLSKKIQESSLTPQFKNINYSALRLIYSPTFTSIHDYWKNHSFD